MSNLLGQIRLSAELVIDPMYETIYYLKCKVSGYEKIIWEENKKKFAHKLTNTQTLEICCN